MSLRLRNFQRPLGAMVFAACLAAALTLRAADGAANAGQPIIFSNPKDAALLPDVSRLGQKDSAARSLQPRFPGGGSLTRSQDSMGGDLPMPAPAQPVFRGSGDGADALGNLTLKTPDQVLQDLALKEILGLPADTMVSPQQSAALMQTLTGSAIRGTSARSRQSANNDLPGPPNALTGTASRDAADPFAGYTGRGSLSLKNLLGTTFSGDVSRSGRQPASLSDVFGLDRGNSQDPVAPGTLGANAAQQNQLDQFRQILDSQTPGMSGSAAALANPNPWLSSNPGPALSAPNPASAFAPSPFAQNSAATPAAPANSVFALPKAPGLPVPSSLDPAAYTPAPARTPPPMEFKIPRRVF